jgi:hypothetical protein
MALPAPAVAAVAAVPLAAAPTAAADSSAAAAVSAAADPSSATADVPRPNPFISPESRPYVPTTPAVAPAVIAPSPSRFAVVGLSVENFDRLSAQPPIADDMLDRMLAALSIAGEVNAPAKFDSEVVSEFSAVNGSDLFVSVALRPCALPYRVA